MQTIKSFDEFIKHLRIYDTSNFTENTLITIYIDFNSIKDKNKFASAFIAEFSKYSSKYLNGAKVIILQYDLIKGIEIKE